MKKILFQPNIKKCQKLSENVLCVYFLLTQVSYKNKQLFLTV